MITGYGDIRVEKSATAAEKNGETGVQLAVDEALGNLLKGKLSAICRRASSAALSGSGTVFIMAEDDFLKRYKVVGLRLTPITAQQIDWVGMKMFVPPFADGSAG